MNDELCYDKLLNKYCFIKFFKFLIYIVLFYLVEFGYWYMLGWIGVLFRGSL